MSKRAFFETKSNQAAIVNYCIANGLSYDKLLQGGVSYGKDYVAFQYVNRNLATSDKQQAKIGGPPAPITLYVKQRGNTLEFEQTEHTRRYLSLDA